MSNNSAQEDGPSREMSEKPGAAHGRERELPQWMQNYVKYIDLSKWDNDIDVPGAEGLETIDYNTYVGAWIVNVDKSGVVYGNFFEQFKDDFEGWTLEIWNQVAKQMRNILRRRLVYHGIWCAEAARDKTVSERFVDLLSKQYPYYWTQQRIDEANNKNLEFHPNFTLPTSDDTPRQRTAHFAENDGNGGMPGTNQETPAPNNGATNPQPNAGGQPGGTQGSPNTGSRYNPPMSGWTGNAYGRYYCRDDTPSPMPNPYRQNMLQQGYASSAPAGYAQSQFNAQPQTPMGYRQYGNSSYQGPSRPYTSFPQAPPGQIGRPWLVPEEQNGDWTPNPQGIPEGQLPTPPESIGRRLVEPEKMYKGDDESKYGGKLYDLLDTKLQIFINRCRKVQIEERLYHLAFDTMLRQRPLQFFYDNLSTGTLDFPTMLTQMRLQFETWVINKNTVTIGPISSSKTCWIQH